MFTAQPTGNATTQPTCRTLVAATFGLALGLANAIHADIYQWEYVNPAIPSLGKQQSSALCIGGAGVNAVAGADISGRFLTKAYLIGKDLDGATAMSTDFTNADLSNANLTNAFLQNASLIDANLTQANLTGAFFAGVTVINANFTGAQIRGADFESVSTLQPIQLYSTASYQAHDLSGVNLRLTNMSGANFVGQNLTNARLAAANLVGADFTGAHVQGAEFSSLTTVQLYSTASYQAHDLTGISLYGSDLTDWNFVSQNLTGANLRATLLTGTNLTGAQIQAANLSRDTSSPAGALTSSQLYSSASYQAHNLRQVSLAFTDMSGWNFVGQNLASAYIDGAMLTGADLSRANLTNVVFDDTDTDPGSSSATLTSATLAAADTRGAIGLSIPPSAITTNLIRPNGHIDGVDLIGGQKLVVRDYDGNPTASPAVGPRPIVVEQQLAMDATGTLRLEFDDDAWDSTISFEPGISVTRGGTLELSFAPDVNLASQLGRTIDLFDWSGVSPSGVFNVVSDYAWNLSNLYTTGEVTLTSLSTQSGDFDGDGDVDGRDFLAWQRNPSIGDLADWQANYGAAGSLAATNIAVPEPSAISLLSVAAILFAWKRCRKLRLD